MHANHAMARCGGSVEALTAARDEARSAAALFLALPANAPPEQLAAAAEALARVARRIPPLTVTP